MAQHPPQPLDETLYKAEEFAFVKEETGICDADTLKKHILAVQTKAYALRGFPCIRRFEFAKTKISVLPAYEQVLKLGREREGAILLDLGCCCGTDIRKVARDGFPMGNLLASDVVADYWNVGHELFRTTPETFPVVFLLGDALDPGFLEPRTPLATPSAEVTDSPPPPLTSLTCLTPLHGRVSVIHISSVFHLFSEEEQLDLARSLAGLLAPLPGSIILGSHNGGPSKGVGRRFKSQGVGRPFMFLHSPESWRELWEGVFPRGTIKVEAELEESTWVDGYDRGWLTWSVSRI
ncbi:hypothetical protein B0H13DRAFT_2233363 [Mycena leptocephala]|nr:hypothetical protein B0H13DRAFT_2233363 [Mycena leptocephala]